MKKTDAQFFNGKIVKWPFRFYYQVENTLQHSSCFSFVSLVRTGLNEFLIYKQVNTTKTSIFVIKKNQEMNSFMEIAI